MDFRKRGSDLGRDGDLEAKGRAHSRRVVEGMECHRDTEEEEVLVLISPRLLAELGGLMCI